MGRRPQCGEYRPFYGSKSIRPEDGIEEQSSSDHGQEVLSPIPKRVEQAILILDFL